MAITPEEKKKRLEILEQDKQTINKLNDLSDIYKKIKSEKSLVDQLNIEEDDDALDKIASKPTDASL